MAAKHPGGHGDDEHHAHAHHSWLDHAVCRRPVLLIQWKQSGTREIGVRNQEIANERHGECLLHCAACCTALSAIAAEDSDSDSTVLTQ